MPFATTVPIMGLREMNAARTRKHLVATAFELFADQGYDGTTMEDVATRADVGVSTLYRYFPTKEALGISILGSPTLMADALRERPADESPEVSLGHAVVAFLEHVEDEPRHAEAFGEIVETNVRVRAGMLEWLAEAHGRLATTLAERRGVPVDDHGAAASAWLAILVIQRMAVVAQEGDTRSGPQIAAEVMRALNAGPILPPRLDT